MHVLLLPSDIKGIYQSLNHFKNLKDENSEGQGLSTANQLKAIEVTQVINNRMKLFP